MCSVQVQYYLSSNSLRFKMVNNDQKIGNIFLFAMNGAISMLDDAISHVG